MFIDVAKVLIPAILAFAVGIGITPIVTHFLYKYKMWRKKARDTGLGGSSAPIFNKLHKDKEVGTPLMGGTVVWGSVLIATVLVWFFSVIDGAVWDKLNFLSRNQTWLPLSSLMLGAVVGLADDFFVVYGKGKYTGGGIPLRVRIGVAGLIGLVAAWWFFFKLGVSGIFVPFLGMLDLGLLFIPFFILVVVAIFSGGIIDGIDGLSGGVFASIFSAYGLIAYFQAQIDIAAFCFAVVGALLAFLWFNIPPARFYLSETGTLALTPTIAIIAFLTDQVVVLPIIAFLLLATSGSVIIQQLSKKLRNGKKVFQVAPFHHHLEAIGWPAYKVTMRLWVLSVMFATLGTIIALIG